METETLSEFDIVLQPLDIIMNLVYDNVIKQNLITLYDKYKKDIVKNKSATEEIKEIINDNSKFMLSLLSKRYRRRLLQFYNYDGLAYYMYVHTNRLTMAYLEELMSIE